MLYRQSRLRPILQTVNILTATNITIITILAYYQKANYIALYVIRKVTVGNNITCSYIVICCCSTSVARSLKLLALPYPFSLTINQYYCINQHRLVDYDFSLFEQVSLVISTITNSKYLYRPFSYRNHLYLRGR